MKLSESNVDITKPSRALGKETYTKAKQVLSEIIGDKTSLLGKVGNKLNKEALTTLKELGLSPSQARGMVKVHLQENADVRYEKQSSAEGEIVQALDDLRLTQDAGREGSFAKDVKNMDNGAFKGKAISILEKYGIVEYVNSLE